MITTTEDVQFKTRDGKTVAVSLAAPQGTQACPAILLMPAIFGVDEAAKSLLNHCAAAGFTAAAPDYFFRTQPGPLSDLAAASARMQQHDIEQGVADMADYLQHLREHPRSNGKVAVLGVCFGGLFAWLSGLHLSVDAIGGFHATRIHAYLNQANALKVPCSLHYGAADPVVPMEQVAQVQAALAPFKHCEVVVHPGGAHNFSMPGKPGYNASIASRAQHAVFQCFGEM